jgi:RimJ/RimL family protein N-acetyltransferase
MRREAHLVQSEFIKNEWTDELIYAILRSEWAAVQAPG